MKTAIYCFSGTGNNLMIAQKLAKKLGNTDILPIRMLKENKVIPSQYDWVGFVTPAYYSHVPPLVKEAMENIKFGEHQKIFTVVGCGINRGASHQDLREKIEQAGKKIQLEYMVSTPGSYIISYNGFPDLLNKIMLNMACKKVDKIAKAILLNQTHTLSKYGIFYKEKNESTLQEQINTFSKVGLSYTVSEECINCHTCINVCPNQNISIHDQKIVFGPNCQQCMACIQWCPKKAIDYNGITHNRVHYHNPQISLKDIKNLQQNH